MTRDEMITLYTGLDRFKHFSNDMNAQVALRQVQQALADTIIKTDLENERRAQRGRE